MLNLLPEENKKELAIEYRRRRAMVSLGFLAALFLATLLLFLPALIVSYNKKNQVSNNYQLIKVASTIRDYDSLRTVIDDVRSKLLLLKPSDNRAYIHDELQAIISQKSRAISITGFDFKPAPPAGKTEISLIGKATSREELVAFSRALEQSPLFSKVEVPVSDLVRGRDIDFSIKITGQF
jgi:Tfp pilus assembly protein PilN